MLALTVVLCVLVLKFVDLKPEVGQNFFFSSDDPSFQEDAQIDRMFPSGSQLIVSVASSDIYSNSYLESMLGGIGLLNIRLDIISAPATNVCIGMAIDSMVHLVFGVRRAQRNGHKGWSAWVAGRREQWRGIVFSDVIIAAGFAIFALSDFPPTQRFGIVVLAGTIIDILSNLFVLPLLGGAEWNVRSRRTALSA